MSKFIHGNAVNNTMCKAIYSGDAEKIESLLETFGFSHCQEWLGGYNLLLTAIQCQRNDIAKLLIERGCRLDSTQDGVPGDAKSIIHEAVTYGDDELVCTLLNKNPILITKTEQGDSLLHLVVMKERGEVMKMLLARKANIECRSAGGMTPLHLAAVRGNIEIIEQLLAAGADLESKDGNEKTSLFLAVSSGNRAVVLKLLEIGANVQCKSKSGLTPLTDAMHRNNIEIVKDLLAYGAKVNDRNSSGETPLHIACMLKNTVLISLLLEAGASVNATDSSGKVPCDAIVKKVSFRNTYFENSSVTYVLGKHFMVLCIGGLYLNKKNRAFYDTFHQMYCREVLSQNEVLLAPSNVLLMTNEKALNDLELMKVTKIESGFSVYSLFQKLKNPTAIVAECELQCLASLNLGNFGLYESIMKNLMKDKKDRNELLRNGQCWFSSLMQACEEELPVLPEEIGIQILSFLTNNQLEFFIESVNSI